MEVEDPSIVLRMLRVPFLQQVWNADTHTYYMCYMYMYVHVYTDYYVYYYVFSCIIIHKIYMYTHTYI